MKKQRKNTVLKLAVSAMCIALCYVLPFLTGGIPQIGNMLCPMHLPVLLCGFLCGPWFGLAVGAVSPLLRSFTLGVPPFYPIALAMAFELAAYGFFSGLFYRKLPKKLPFLYVSLLSAMVIGRVVWGILRLLMFGLGGEAFGWTAFMAGAFSNALPGIMLQLVLVPAIVLAIQKNGSYRKM